MDQRIKRTADEWAIRDTLARYWRGVDRRDVDLVASAYAPEAYDDHGYYQGPIEGFVEGLPESVWAHFETTQHFSGHIAVDFAPCGDLALAESYAEAHHIRRDDAGRVWDHVYGLRYVDRFERVAGAWRIAHRSCAWDWARVDSFDPIPLDAGYVRGRSLADDPVAAHPSGSSRPVSSEQLLAKQACLDTLARYTRGVDRCDPALVMSAYHEDAFDDHGGYQGDAAGFVAWVQPTVMDAFACTMHKLGQSLVEVKGDRAWAETYAIAHHVSVSGDTAADLIMGVRYLDVLEDRGTGWKIADRRMTFEWERLVPLGSQAPHPGFSAGLRDGSDPVLAAQAGGRVAAPARVERAADRAEIQAVLLRYCRGVDRRQSHLIRSAYHPDAWDDHGTYQGGLEGFLAFVAEEVWSRFRLTMHKLGQALIEIEGNTAVCETYAVCHHVSTEGERDRQDLVMGIRYLDRFERRSGEWRIARRQLRWEWVRLDALADLDSDWTLGRVDEADPVLVAARSVEAGEDGRPQTEPPG